MNKPKLNDCYGGKATYNKDFSFGGRNKEKYPKVDIPIEEIAKTFDTFNKNNLAISNVRIDCIQIDTGKEICLDFKQMLDFFNNKANKKKK